MMLRRIYDLFLMIRHKLGYDGWLDADYVEVMYE